MSLRDTRDIGTAKIVMLGGGGGGGSYTAGNGINITNNTIINTRKGALTGVIDSVSSNIAHTQITGARDTFVAGALILLQSEAAGTADNLRIQYGAQSSESQTFAIYDTSGTAASITIASGDTVIMMIDNTGYRAIILNVLSASGGSSYAGLGIGKKTGVSSNIIDTDIDLHRAPIVGDRLLIYFDEKVTNPTGLTTYNNGTAVTSNVESVSPLNFGNGWNIFEFKNDGLLYDNCWARVQNVAIPNNTLYGLSDTQISTNPSNGQALVYDTTNNKWKNKTLVEANTGTAVTQLKKLNVGGIVYDTNGARAYVASNVANNRIIVPVLNIDQYVGEIIAIDTGSHSGSSSGWSLALSDGMEMTTVTMTRADGTAFSDDISENELLFVYVDTAGLVARVLDIPVDTTEIKTVSGNPITLTDAVAGNAIEVSAEIVASQSGSGTPSPTNVRPISGFSSVTITREDAQGQTATVTVALGSTVYGGMLNLTTGELTITHGYKDLGTLSYAYDSGNHRFTAYISDLKLAPVRTLQMICSCYQAITDGRPIGQVPDGSIYNDPNDHIIYIHDSRYTVASDLATALDGQEVVYPLATPTTTTLTAAQLALVKGYNQLSCNSGDMEITYKASGLDALKERVDDLEDAVADLETDMASKAENSVVGTVESGTTASQAYAVGEHFIRNDKFCTAIATIASGATLTLNTNYVEGTIAEAITNKYNYSTTEHVVGKWIDGKTLYERTFEVGNLPSGGDKKYDTLIPTSTIPATNVKGLYGQATSSSNGMIPLPYTNGGNNTTYDVGMAIIVQNNKLAIFLHSAANRSDFTATVTMQYTKP